jgi:DNA-binding NarL/FixJ family response regulator
LSSSEPSRFPVVTAVAPEANRSQDDARRRLSALTPREREVAQAVGRGLTNAELAAALNMSVATVKAHVSRPLAKLGLENRVQIALLVHDADLD